MIIAGALEDVNNYATLPIILAFFKPSSLTLGAFGSFWELSVEHAAAPALSGRGALYGHPEEWETSIAVSRTAPLAFARLLWRSVIN